MSEAGTRLIRTPDQRLRVFVSSTLQEVLDERKAAREAIERLRLAPVMFELGARPHPPRDLYRAYLAQSDVFVGIYWQRYGWVAPSETISGLEDEYVLSGPMPKLIYIKRTDTREARLDELFGPSASSCRMPPDRSSSSSARSIASSPKTSHTTAAAVPTTTRSASTLGERPSGPGPW